MSIFGYLISLDIKIIMELEMITRTNNGLQMMHFKRVFIYTNDIFSPDFVFDLIYLRAFDFAFDLCRLEAKNRLPSVHFKLAQQLEEEGEFEKAEMHYIKSGKPREAILMYIHDQNWESAERIAKYISCTF